MKNRDKTEIGFKIVAYTVIGLFSLLAIYPVIYAFSSSISGKNAYEAGDVILLPKQIQFVVYELIYSDKGFWISYINTIFYAFFGTLWSMLISVTGAYALSKSRLLFRRQFNFLVVFTMWFSAGMIPLYLNYVNMNVDNRWGMIFAFGVQAYNIILLRSAFESVPTEIEEAARVDGAGVVEQHWWSSVVDHGW